MKSLKANRKIIVTLVLLTFLLTIPLVITNILEEKNLNLAGWSRSVDLEEKAINKSTFYRMDEKGINLYMSESKNTIKKINMDEITLDIKEKSTIQSAV